MRGSRTELRLAEGTYSKRAPYQLFFHAGLLDPRTTSTGSSQ
jgi:hypothetical protein